MMWFSRRYMMLRLLMKINVERDLVCYTTRSSACNFARKMFWICR